jgi:ketosteroid isomerase-like protein
MAHPNEDTVRQGYEAFSAGDMDTLSGLFTEDAVWHVAGNNQLSGDRRGVGAILGYFGELMEVTNGTFRIDQLVDVLANDQRAVGIQVNAGEKDGQTHRFSEVIVFSMSNGKFAEAWEHPGDGQAFDEFIG